MDNDRRQNGHRKAGVRFNVLMVPEGGGNVRTFRTSKDFLVIVVLLMLALIGAAVMYVINNAERDEEYQAKIGALEQRISTLSEDIIVLEADNENLQNQLRSANALLESKSVEEEIEQETEEVDLSYVPTFLPVFGTVSIPSPYTQENQYITFTTGDGSKVVSAADGIVVYAGESVENGYCVKVNHGNGYETVYYEDNTPYVAEGMKVKRGDTLYEIHGESKVLKYQISYEGQFIDPYTIMDIDG
ncbi:MAG: peptidoglycan DD-metalloendopeptidase family protein [Lachnospiraceae bacterium]|nr:peptidoglycan DD-metalloendopeptidase family protein [Lachnospiraceae bacterium]